MSNVILLADDSPDDVLIFKRMLRRVGITNPVHVVTDGFQAIAYMTGEGFYADRDRFPVAKVLFLDLLMPRADGWFVLNWLSTQPPANKPLVIVLSGVGEFSRLHDAYAMGAHSFIFKPLQAEELRGLIEYWPDQWTMKHSEPKDPPGRNRLQQGDNSGPPPLPGNERHSPEREPL
ncbi:MAG TPA: response regulator [Verrucomicrobiae bacterium]|nr:response regulator [Verrucomicrobiae bacterium]